RGPHPLAPHGACARRWWHDRPRILCRGVDPARRLGDRLPRPRPRRAVANRMATGSRPTMTAEPLIMALPNGRILGEVMPMLAQMGIEPEPAFTDPKSRALRFETSDPNLAIIRVRAFDVATFVAFGAAQIGVAGND